MCCLFDTQNSSEEIITVAQWRYVVMQCVFYKRAQTEVAAAEADVDDDESRCSLIQLTLTIMCTTNSCSGGGSVQTQSARWNHQRQQHRSHSDELFARINVRLDVRWDPAWQPCQCPRPASGAFKRCNRGLSSFPRIYHPIILWNELLNWSENGIKCTFNSVVLSLWYQWMIVNKGETRERRLE